MRKDIIDIAQAYAALERLERAKLEVEAARRELRLRLAPLQAANTKVVSTPTSADEFRATAAIGRELGLGTGGRI